MNLQRRVRQELPEEDTVPIGRYYPWAVAQDERALLRALLYEEPPAGLRQAVLSTVDVSRAAVNTWAPLVFATVIMPISLLAAGLVLIYGLTAWEILAGSLVILSLFIHWTTRRPVRYYGPHEPAGFRETAWPVVRAILVETGSWAAGTIAASLTASLVVVLIGGRLHFGG